MSVRLYVGNLPKEPIDRQDLQAMFADEVGETASTKVIKDRKTGKCRGFAFVTVPNDEIADALIEKYNGQAFMDSPIKIEKALPRAKGKDKEESEEASSETEPVPAPVKGAANRRNTGGKKRSRQTSNKPESETVQPDPRWADELTKLKEMLAAQTSNS